MWILPVNFATTLTGYKAVHGALRHSQPHLCNSTTNSLLVDTNMDSICLIANRCYEEFYLSLGHHTIESANELPEYIALLIRLFGWRATRVQSHSQQPRRPLRGGLVISGYTIKKVWDPKDNRLSWGGTPRPVRMEYTSTPNFQGRKWVKVNLNYQIIRKKVCSNFLAFTGDFYAMIMKSETKTDFQFQTERTWQWIPWQLWIKLDQQTPTSWTHSIVLSLV